MFKSIFINKKTPYLRPYICNGNYGSAKIILAGINPATPIYPFEISIDEYQSLILDYNKFIKYYSDSRVKMGKPSISRTRQGIISLVDWINSELNTSVIETDIYTYPTASVKELATISQDYLDLSKKLFWEVLTTSNANILILYGTKTVKDFFEILDLKMKVFAIRHLMYYGKTGASFSEFRNKLKQYYTDEYKTID